ncbi:hypothetical protein ACWXZL_33650, partial [Pseudomonas aeruginosa]
FFCLGGSRSLSVVSVRNSRVRFVDAFHFRRRGGGGARPPGLGDLVKGSATGLFAAIITAVDLD